VQGLPLESRKREETKKEKIKSGVKPDIFLPHAPPRNRGNAVRIKTSS